MSKPIPYEAIRKKNLANIMAKLQAGKTLTTAESKIIDADKREAEGLRPDKTDDELAEEFGCVRMSIHRAKKLGVRFDVDDATTYADCKK